uniref:Poly [ADP-ribose] polymerase n=1 Tax=Ciona savignyi TaxID=51511 RepID=H2YS08_CIOSA
KMPRKKASASKRKAEIKAEPEEVPVKKEKDETSTSDLVKEEIQEKVVIFTGSVPIDEECTLDPKQYHVYKDAGDGGLVYNAMLNQTNIGANNNKYYIIQLLKHTNKSEFFLWSRWGRVGKIAGKSLDPIVTVNAGKTKFEKKFRDKTGNYFSMGLPFRKIKGKYDKVEIDYGEEETKKTVKPSNKIKKVKAESTLHKSVQDVINLLFDITEWEESVKEMKFDIKKSPLGKLTKNQITAGYEALKEIETCLAEEKLDRPRLLEACGAFYTKIPHDFGMKTPSIIENTEQLKEKLDLLEALNEIQIAINLVEETEDEDNTSPIDLNYKSLNCELTPLGKTDKTYKVIEKYVKNTHASTHSGYTLCIQDVFAVSRESDCARFKKEIGSCTLLWHGSRLTNWCGILKQGLRIAPPEAPTTGYMFGKGVYFADMVSKSANYCRASERQPIGFLLLSEVALGNCNELYAGDYRANNLPKGKHSTKGMGQQAPNAKQAVKLENGTLVPLGKPTNQPTKEAYLMYNEFIVYDVAQINPRFLVKVKFNMT